MTQILLIRHAQSANNSLPEHQRVADPALTELGVRQAELTGDCLQSWPLTHLYCSPFLRSLETMRPIAAKHPEVPVSVQADIFELGGCYSGYDATGKKGESGRGRSQLHNEYPTWEIDARISDEGWWGKPFESSEDGKKRSQQVAGWLCREIVPLGGVHAFVIHADFKRLLIESLCEMAMLGTATAPFMYALGPLFNVGITRFQWEEDRWKLVTFNATTHLPADSVT